MIANLFVDLAVGSYVWYTIYLKTRPTETSCTISLVRYGTVRVVSIVGYLLAGGGEHDPSDEIGRAMRIHELASIDFDRSSFKVALIHRFRLEIV